MNKLGFRDAYKLVRIEGGKEIYARTYYFAVDQNYDHFITEDDTPVDNIFSEREQRLLINPLYANLWTDRDFMAFSNVGIYYEPKLPPVVPDMFISFDIKAPENWREKKNRAYFAWLYGKGPELVLEVVSNKEGGEAERKMDIYAHMGVKYYVLVDPDLLVFPARVQVFQLSEHRHYVPLLDKHNYMPEIKLGITLWEGLFEDFTDDWARWCDKQGNILKTAQENAEIEKERAKLEKERADNEKERANQEKERADNEKERAKLEKERADNEKERANQEKERADNEKERANQEKERADKLIAQLKKLGLEPEE
ncbi:MAG: Uma2 family endonuclease [Bacteroidota bacterium]